MDFEGLDAVNIVEVQEVHSRHTHSVTGVACRIEGGQREAGCAIYWQGRAVRPEDRAAATCAT